ncbi:6-hydroxymethylpterin diphosphokinase MptE-like protein [Cohnella sp.]|uniref:motility associated factor glycosyltransferase family protein n=1 Tax=Cohnella sp. TaxID=1883426 RepID=UPI0035654E2B
MKKYAADNLMFLREHYPEIYNLVRNKTPNKAYITGEPSKNGTANVALRNEQGILLHLYSKYDPQLEVARWTESHDDRVLNADHVLMVGFGLGYHAEAFMNAYPNKRVYIYEPNVELFLTAIESNDLRNVLGNQNVAMFAVGQEDQLIMDMLVSIYNSLKGEFSYVLLPPYRKLDPTLEDRMNKLMILVASNFRSNIHTVAKFKGEWIENSIVNMERVLRTPSFTALRGVCQGKPAVIVGSGPSLGLEAETLRQLRNHAFIIAAGTSIMGLLHHGIEPHLIISMDPGENNARAFAKLDIAHIPFLFLSTIKHTSITNDRSNMLMHGFFNIDVVSRYLLDLTEEDAILSSSSTVSGTAIQIAAYFDCSEIVFIGQDFSYPGNQVYSAGVNHGSRAWAQKKVSTADLLVKNVSGGENVTNHTMLHLKTDLEAVIRSVPNVPFYNASPVGAVIEYTEIKTLQQLLNQREKEIIDKNWFKQQMEQSLKIYSPEKQKETQQRISRVLKELSRTDDALAQLSKHISSNSRDYESWFSQFEEMWSLIVNHEIFEKWFSFFLVTEKIYAERYWSEMYGETDLNLKRQKLIACARPLIDGMQKLTPQLIILISELRNKLTERG